MWPLSKYLRKVFRRLERNQEEMVIPKAVKLVEQCHSLCDSHVPLEQVPLLLEVVVSVLDLLEWSPPAVLKQFVSEMCSDAARRHVPNRKPDH